MFKLILLFNLKKLIVNKEMEKLYFGIKHAVELKADLKQLKANIDKLQGKGKKTDKDIVRLSKMELEFSRIFGNEQSPGIVGTYKQFSVELEYFKGLSKTIKENLWRFS